MDTNIDFSNEDCGKSVKFYDGCWVIAPTPVELTVNMKKHCGI